MRILLSILLVLLFVPPWSGTARLDLLGQDARMSVRPVRLSPDDPARTRLGALTYLGGMSLHSPDPAFGGFSSLAVRGDRFTLLSDGGNIVRFRLAPDWRVSDLSFANLPAGPGSGWQKIDRDSESTALDDSGRTWVGFEYHNAIWRYAPGFASAERSVEPAAMARWPQNGGPESLVRLRDGRFLVLGETARWPHQPGRASLIFAGDPTEAKTPPARFVYRPARGFDPSDATQLPDGRLLVLERRLSLFPPRFLNRLVIVPLAAVRPGAIVRGKEIARLAAPLIHDNFEGVVAKREGAATVIWLVSDDNQSVFQRSLLLKFRLDAET